MTTNFFSPLSFVGSGIRDPGSGMGKNQDPGSGINIPDPQHCVSRIPDLFHSGLRIQIPNPGVEKVLDSEPGTMGSTVHN